MKVYAGVSWSGGAASVPIVLVTEAAMDGPWTFGLERPATHAFVVLQHSDGLAWRLDAGYGGLHEAVWSPFVDTAHVRIWEAGGGHDNLVQQMAHAARGLTGQRYDGMELVAQGASVMSKLPMFARLAAAATNADWARGMICTKLTKTVLEAGGYKVELPDLLPERFARWCGENII